MQDVLRENLLRLIWDGVQKAKLRVIWKLRNTSNALQNLSDLQNSTQNSQKDKYSCYISGSLQHHSCHDEDTLFHGKNTLIILHWAEDLKGPFRKLF